MSETLRVVEPRPFPIDHSLGSDSVQEPSRVLIVDDNKAIHDDYRKVLEGPSDHDVETENLETALFGHQPERGPRTSRRFVLESAHQGHEALDCVRAARAAGRPFALAFLDVRMPPGWDGVETAARIWEEEADIQIVLCSAFSDYSWSETVGRLDHRDSLLILRKPFDNSEVLQLAHALTQKWELTRRVRNRMKTLESKIAGRTRELQVANEALKDLVCLDPLTGLLNRRGLQERLALELQRRTREPEPLGAVLIDCDRFKRINDTSGYTTGDAVLVEVAERIKRVVRVTDHVSRIGGDEFVMLLPSLAARESQQIAERVRRSIADDPIVTGSGDVNVTVSAGVCDVTQATELEGILSQVQNALRESKTLGRNRVSMTTRSGRRATERRLLVKRLLAPANVQVVERPLVRLEDDSIAGHQFLVRSTIEGIRNARDLADALPPIPEEGDDGALTTVDLHQWTACLAAGRSRAPGSVCLVHLFASTVLASSQAALLEQIGEVVRERALWVELTLDRGITQPNHLVERATTLRDLGAKIVLAGLGLKRSMLEALILLSPDVVTLQSHLMERTLAYRSNWRSLTRVTDLARAAGATMVASGITTDHDVKALRTLGIEYGLGPRWAQNPVPRSVERRLGAAS